MPNNPLHDRLRPVVARMVFVRVCYALALCWCLGIVMLLGLVAWERAGNALAPWVQGVPLLTGLLAAFVAFLFVSRTTRPAHAAASVETAFPDLQQRLTTALEQHPRIETGELSFLQRQVVQEALDHEAANEWRTAVSRRQMAPAIVCQWGAFLLFVGLSLGLDFSRGVALAAKEDAGRSGEGSPLHVTVEPGNAELERASSLVVLVRFTGGVPAEATLVIVPEEGKTREFELRRNFDDPVLVGRVGSVTEPFSYHVRYGEQTTESYAVTVFEYPELVRADAEVTYPAYAGRERQMLEDVRAFSIAEGGSARLLCRLNKPVAKAALVDDAGQPLRLQPQSSDPTLYEMTLAPKESARYELELEDNRGRTNRENVEFFVEVIPNRRPELKLTFPGRDLRVSPIEEVSLEATAWDDFGIKQAGLVYSIEAESPQTLVLAEQADAQTTQPVSHLLSLEKLDAEPDQLVSYYFYADDVGPDGESRRTVSDLFFAEVRHFEEIFRQGQQPSGSQQRQQQQQQGGGRQNQADQLAKQQKQIVTATWNLIRRGSPDAKFVEDVTVVRDSQQKLIETAGALVEKLQDPGSRTHAEQAVNHMHEAVEALSRAADERSAGPLQQALQSEQAAYRSLLKLRAREHKVVRQQQSGGGRSQASSSGRSQQQLQQLELKNNSNRYQQQQAASRQQLSGGAREQLQVLNRLRELARRQGDTNKKLKELEAALRAAKTEEEREDLERRLKRLREEQKQLLRDLDSLRQRMERSEDQQSVAEARSRLNETRSRVRQASEALEKGQTSRALSQGTRAERELSRMRDEFRKKVSSEFADAARNLRDQAREIDEKERELADKLDPNSQKASRRLRGPSERDALEDAFRRQKQDVGNLLDDARRLVEAAEDSEPLLSKQLYETVRKARVDEPERALEATAENLRRGRKDEARETEKRAAEGISQLAEGIDRAAEGVLGNELEGLKLAEATLEKLRKAVEREAETKGGKVPPQSGKAERGKPADGGGKSGKAESGKPGEPQEGGRRQDGNARESNDGQRREPSAQSGDSQRGTPQSGNRQGEKPRSGQSQSNDGQRSSSSAQGRNSRSQTPQDGQSSSGGQSRSSQQPGSARPTSESRRGGGLRRGGQRESGREQPGFVSQAGERGPGGVLTGGNFLDWSDRMREVEEMVGDPKLRQRAAEIRDRARSMRAEFKRHSKTPEWDLVETEIVEPMAELQRRVAEEIARRQSDRSLVPIDRDPVPPPYSELVRKYYERLGSSGP